MREILFRGKCVGNGKWVYGHYIVGRISGYPMIDDMARGEYIDPATLGQFTGLYDKNGKRIFEGDIVRYAYNNSVVQFCTEEVGSCGCCYPSFEGSGFKAYGASLCASEVVGNIHDNPDLLRGGTQCRK